MLSAAVHAVYNAGCFPARTPANTQCAAVVLLAECVHPQNAGDIVCAAVQLAGNESFVSGLSSKWMDLMLSDALPFTAPPDLRLVSLSVAQ